MSVADIVLVLGLGACFGSFISLVSYRLPREEDVVLKASYCPSCGRALRIIDLVPVLSWLSSRGRCARCKSRVSWRYPAIELAAAALFLVAYREYGPTLHGLILMLSIVALLVMIVVDLEHYIIPDSINTVLILFGIAWHLTPLSSALGAMSQLSGITCGMGVGLSLGLTLRYGYRWLRKKEGLGLGDVKFLVVAGTWLGMMTFVPFLFLAGIFGVLTALLWRALKRGERFPFGPALAASLFVCVTFPNVPEAFWHMQAWIYH